MKENIEKARKALTEADAILTGASNGLSISEGYNIFADNEMFRASAFPFGDRMPWEITTDLNGILMDIITLLGNDYIIDNGVAIHKTAVIGHNVTIKSPAIISRDCFVGSNSYLRNGIFLAPGAKVGISCEI